MYEWVLKVAMFESMLHTTLYTLQRERGMRFHVEAVDPGMVVGTVHESLALNMKREMKFSGNRPKRVRVDLVGRWLGEWAESAGLARATTTKYGEEITAPPDPVYASHEGAWRGGDVNPHNKITVGEGQDEGGDKEIRDFAMSYLREWQDNVRRRRARDGATTLLDKKWAQAAENLSYHGILKLDDLADCLVQGVTWLDWHVMREKVDTEGEATLKRLELPVSNRAMKERDPEERLDTEHI